MRNDIFDSLEEIGILLSENEKAQDDLDLTTVIADSLQYINFLVTLEERIGQTIPDEFYNPENMHSLKLFEEALKSIEQK